MNICIDCKHFSNIGGTDLIWYNLYCQASQNKRTKCPVTGEMTWGHAQEFEHCRSVNHGNCPKFESKLEDKSC